MALLEIKNLHVKSTARQILNGLNLTVREGAGRGHHGPERLRQVDARACAGGQGRLRGRPTGQVLLNGEDLLALAPDERAAKGLFLAFQYPLEIPGVATMTFLRTALNAQRKKRGEEELSTPDFNRRVFDVAAKLEIDRDMLRRGVNVGFSGGEKKRNEILQMALLEPKLAVLDETDSGLDIDALKVVSDGVNRLRSPERVVRGHHPLPAAARLHRARRRARALDAAASCVPAARSWRSSSKRRVTRSIRKRWRHERRDSADQDGG